MRRNIRRCVRSSRYIKSSFTPAGKIYRSNNFYNVIEQFYYDTAEVFDPETVFYIWLGHDSKYSYALVLMWDDSEVLWGFIGSIPFKKEYDPYSFPYITSPDDFREVSDLITIDNEMADIDDLLNQFEQLEDLSWDSDIESGRKVRGKRVTASKRTSGRISHKRPVKASLDYDKFYDRMDSFHADRINRAGYNFLRRMDYDQRLQILRAAKKEVGAWSVSLEALEDMADYMVGNNSLDRVIDKVLTLGNYDAMVDSMISVVECACVMAVDQSRNF